jgi:hypothetical protein
MVNVRSLPGLGPFVWDAAAFTFKVTFMLNKSPTRSGGSEAPLIIVLEVAVPEGIIKASQ